VVPVSFGVNADRNVRGIVSGGRPRSRIQPARTTSRQGMFAYSGRGLVVSLNTCAGELLSRKPFGCPTGHSSPNERCFARTRSLKPTVPCVWLIDIETTRGAALRTLPAVSRESQAKPLFAEEGTATANPNGAATTTTRTRTHQPRIRPSTTP